MRLVGVVFSAMDTVRFALPEPEEEDSVIHEASFDAVHAAFEVIETLLETEADVTEMLEGETVGVTTLAPLWYTIISWLSEPDDRFVSDTVTTPERSDVLVLAFAFTVMVLPLVVTVIQLASFEVVNVPSVLTVTLSEPPPASKARLVGDIVRYLPSCVTVTLAVPALFLIVIVPVRGLVVLFSEMDKVTFVFPGPDSDDIVIHEASLEDVQLAFELMDILLEVEADETEMLDGLTDGASTDEPFCVTFITL